ncbi:MAG: SH3 domain-containing protein [Alphaproteobacteria bacterium]|nr:SH3 domain-containing protein [Alphaproteobacteria bacterium]
MIASEAMHNRANKGLIAFIAVFVSLWFLVATHVSVRAETICNANVTVSNIRKGPSSKTYEVQDEIANGQQIEVLDRITNDEDTVYLKIKYNGSNIGYIYHKFVANGCDSSNSSSPYQAPNGYCYFVLTSRKTSLEVSNFTNTYSSFKEQFQIYIAKNGWNIITIGTIRKSQFESQQASYLESKLFLGDTLCSAGKEFESKWEASNSTVNNDDDYPRGSVEDLEIYLTELNLAIDNKDHKTAVVIFIILDEMDIEKPETFDFHFGLSLAGIGEYDQSISLIENFASTIDESSWFHAAAVSIIPTIRERELEEVRRAEMFQSIKEEAARIEKENALREANRKKYGKWQMPVKESPSNLKNETRKEQGDIYLISNETRNESISDNRAHNSGVLVLSVSCFAQSQQARGSYNERIDLYIIDGDGYEQNLVGDNKIEMTIDGRTVNLPWSVTKKDRGEHVETGLYKQNTNITRRLIQNLITAETLQIRYPIEGKLFGVFNFDLTGMHNASKPRGKNCNWY